jgi:molybdenum cofactor cytidylyltransferase
VQRGIVGLLLAAGAGKRFGGNKLMHPLQDGTPMAVAAAINLKPACDHLIAIVRPKDDELASALANVGCEIVVCADAELGMGHSLAAGVRATEDAAGWIVALGDMPFIATTSHQAVAARLREGASLVATQYQNRRGHPVGFANKWFAELSSLDGDQGARSILETHQQDVILCKVDEPGVLWDIDQAQDLEYRSH